MCLGRENEIGKEGENKVCSSPQPLKHQQMDQNILIVVVVTVVVTVIVVVVVAAAVVITSCDSLSRSRTEQCWQGISSMDSCITLDITTSRLVVSSNRSLARCSRICSE